MIILKVVTVSLGLAFLIFGYLIYFQKKYNLINGFEKEYKAGRKTEQYAHRIGLVEMILGAVFLAAGILLIFFA